MTDEALPHLDRDHRATIATGQRVVVHHGGEQHQAARVLMAHGTLVELDRSPFLAAGARAQIGFESDSGPCMAAVVAEDDGSRQRLRLTSAAERVPERRESPRTRLRPTVRAVVLHAGGLPAGTRVSGPLVDLSLTGVAFQPNAPLPIGALVTLRIVEADGGALADELDAIVVRIENRDDRQVCGCRFADPQPGLVAAIGPEHIAD